MGVIAYNMKLKEKEEMKNAKIDRKPNKKGYSYFCKGKGSDGTGMCVAMGEATALAAIKNKDAKKGEGWD